MFQLLEQVMKIISRIPYFLLCFLDVQEIIS